MAIYLILGLLGVIGYTLAKIISLQKDFKAANQEFVFSKFFRCDWPGMALSVVMVLALALFKDEVFNYKPAAASYIKIIFFFVGAMGAWLFVTLVGAIRGGTKKWIRGVIDEKTNIADSKTDEL